MSINPRNVGITWPVTHTERDLAQAEADDWQSEFVAAMREMHASARTDEERATDDR